MNDEIEDCSIGDSRIETENTKEESKTEDEMEIEISLCKNYKTRSQRNGKQTGQNYTKNVATQTGVFKLIPKVPVHLKEKQIKPRYIETMPLLVLLRLFALYILWILLFGGRHAICHLSQTRHIKIC